MDEKMLTLPRFEEASEIVKKVTLETKLVYSDFLSERYGNKIYLKPENMQFTGAYKVRGAYYAMSTLSHCFIVAHVHDELIIECPMAVSLKSVCEQMGRTPPWIKGLSLRADGYETMFYKKD